VKPARIYPNGTLMRFVVIDERGEVFAKRAEFPSRHPGQGLRAGAIEACVRCPHWTEKPLSDRNLIMRFSVN
jgi:hypothetical protein